MNWKIHTVTGSFDQIEEANLWRLWVREDAPTWRELGADVDFVLEHPKYGCVSSLCATQELDGEGPEPRSEPVSLFQYAINEGPSRHRDPNRVDLIASPRLPGVICLPYRYLDDHSLQFGFVLRQRPIAGCVCTCYNPAKREPNIVEAPRGFTMSSDRSIRESAGREIVEEFPTEVDGFIRSDEAAYVGFLNANTAFFASTLSVWLVRYDRTGDKCGDIHGQGYAGDLDEFWQTSTWQIGGKERYAAFLSPSVFLAQCNRENIGTSQGDRNGDEPVYCGLTCAALYLAEQHLAGEQVSVSRGTR